MGKINLNIGSKIKMLRELKGYSQESVALDLNISQQAFQQIEAGKTRVGLQRASKIAKCLQIELETLLSFQPTNYLNSCTQVDIQTNPFVPQRVVEQLENNVLMLKAEIEFLRVQNMKLMDLLSKENS